MSIVHISLRSFLSVSLVVALLSFFLSGCGSNEGFEVEVPAPQSGKITEMNVDFAGTPVALSVEFPDGPVFYSSATLVLDKGGPNGTTSARTAAGTFFQASKVESQNQNLRVELSFDESNLPFYTPDNQRMIKKLSLTDLPIGTLRKYGADTVKACNAFLVADNLAMTNHHCMKTMDDCKIAQLHLSNSKQSGLFFCRDLLFTDEGADQTLFELDADASAFGVLDLESKPYQFAEHTLLQISSENQNVRRERECEVIKKYPNFNVKSYDPAIVIRSAYRASCDAMNGDSGSAVLNQDFRVIGILWGFDLNKASWFSPIDPSILDLISKRKKSALAKR